MSSSLSKEIIKTTSKTKILILRKAFLSIILSIYSESIPRDSNINQIASRNNKTGVIGFEDIFVRGISMQLNANATIQTKVILLTWNDENTFVKVGNPACS